MALPAMYSVIERKKRENAKWSGTKEVSKIEAKEKKNAVRRRASFLDKFTTSLRIR